MKHMFSNKKIANVNADTKGFGCGTCASTCVVQCYYLCGGTCGQSCKGGWHSSCRTGCLSNSYYSS